MNDPSSILQLATYRKLIATGVERWGAFLGKRAERLAQWQRRGRIAEKVAENILEDLFTEVLDWGLADLNHQVDYADMVLTALGIKCLLVETKHPGALAWNRHAVEEALAQARRYADEQKVRCIAVSDGIMLYAADLENGGLKDRLGVSLAQESFPEDLWWLSRHGIYRPRPECFAISVGVLPEKPAVPSLGENCSDGTTVQHPKYRLPASCFAYVEQADRASTWKLPYRKADGSVDERRLPKAIQCLLSNYRGSRVGGIPEAAVPDVLGRLAHAACETGKMPHQLPATADVYRQLAQVLHQLGRLEEVAQR